MDKDLLMLYGARHAVLKMLEAGNCSFAKTLDNETWLTVEYTDICNYLTEMIDKHKADREVLADCYKPKLKSDLCIMDEFAFEPQADRSEE